MLVFTCVPKRKRILDGGNSQDPRGSEMKVTDMEVDEFNYVPTWATRKIEESKLIAEECVVTRKLSQWKGVNHNKRK
jgi:hypothetical protein